MSSAPFIVRRPIAFTVVFGVLTFTVLTLLISVANLIVLFVLRQTGFHGLGLNSEVTGVAYVVVSLMLVTLFRPLAERTFVERFIRAGGILLISGVLIGSAQTYLFFGASGTRREEFGFLLYTYWIGHVSLFLVLAAAIAYVTGKPQERRLATP